MIEMIDVVIVLELSELGDLRNELKKRGKTTALLG